MMFKKIIKIMIVLFFVSFFLIPNVCSDDVPIILNQLPVVDVTMDGFVTPISLLIYSYNFLISANVDDPENREMTIMFYCRLNPDYRWYYITSFVGYDGVYDCSKYFIEQGLHDKTIYWMIEIVDGLETGYYYYDFTIEV